MREIFAPGPTKAFDDFDYKYEGQKSSSKAEVKPSKSALVGKPTKPNRLKANRLNGVPIGTNFEDFDVVGSLDLFNPSQLDDR